LTSDVEAPPGKRLHLSLVPGPLDLHRSVRVEILKQLDGGRCDFRGPVPAAVPLDPLLASRLPSGANEPPPIAATAPIPV
jgi:hypothetical protein